MDWKISFTPNDTADLTVRQAANKVNPKIVLAIGIGRGPAVLTKDIVVEDIAFQGSMRVRLQLMNNFPHVKTIDLSFLQPPIIDFVLKPIGFDIKLVRPLVQCQGACV
jgi:Ca2+-dependent lipid-binding protein